MKNKSIIKADTFSANSLKILQKNKEEFIEKYVYNLEIKKHDKKALLGQKFHGLICACLNGFDVSKMSFELNEEEKNYWQNIKKYIDNIKKNVLKTEYPFLIKESLNNKSYYLTGRFDAIFKFEDKYIIYDWKTLNLPEAPEDDMQSIVYLFCANKIFKTENIKIKYVSIKTQKSAEAGFKTSGFYKNKIEEVILKLPNYKNIE